MLVLVLVSVIVTELSPRLVVAGYEKCILVGHDWGGAVAWSYTAMYPEHVERLIVLNIPHPKAFEKHALSSLSQMRKSWSVCLLYCALLYVSWHTAMLQSVCLSVFPMWCCV